MNASYFFCAPTSPSMHNSSSNFGDGSMRCIWILHLDKRRLNKLRSREAEYFSQVHVTNRRDEAHIWNSFVFLAGCVLLGMVSSMLTYFSDLRFNSSPSMRCENKIFFRKQSKFSPSSCNQRYQEVAPPQNTFSGHLHNAKILNRNAFA